MAYYYMLFAIACSYGALLTSRKISWSFKHQSNDNTKSIRIYLIIVFILVAIIIGFRKRTVGADTNAYIINYFNKVIDQGVFIGQTEIILELLAWIASLISHDYQLFLFLAGSITSFLFAKFIFDNSENVFLSVAIFLGMYFVQSMNLMREWLALGFGLNAYSYYHRQKNGIAIILLVLATLTHNSAISLILIPIIEISKNKKRTIIVLGIACLVLLLGQNIILPFLTNFIPRYEAYLTMSMFVNEGGFNIKDVIYIGILSYYIFRVRFEKKGSTDEELNRYSEYICLLMVSITFSLCGQRFYMLHRLVYYYSAFLIVSIPEIIESSRFRQFLTPLLIVSMFIMLFRNKSVDNNSISHYLFFWQ